ncbi:MAG: PHP-associated domain-containing protein [archaeon]
MILRARVSFEKPDLLELTKKGYAMADMHVHSRYSDTFTRIHNLIRKAEKLNIGFALTDHNEIGGAMQAVGNSSGVMVIPGMEVTSYEGLHILLYFYTTRDLEEYYSRYIEPNKSANPHMYTNVAADDVLSHAQNYNCITCAAHPFSPTIMGLYKSIRKQAVEPGIINKLDAFEVICANHLRGMNMRALEWAEELGKGITGGSDSHSLFEMGRVVSYSEADSVESFLEAIRGQRNYVCGKELRNVHRIASYTKMLNRHLQHLSPTIGLQYNAMIKRPITREAPKIRNKITTLKNRGKEGIIRGRAKLADIKKNPIKEIRSVKEKIKKRIVSTKEQAPL